MHKHSYSLFVTIERLIPEPGTPKAFYKCDCGSELSSGEGLAIINAAQPVLVLDAPQTGVFFQSDVACACNKPLLSTGNVTSTTCMRCGKPLGK
jgi:hypothetical protein